MSSKTNNAVRKEELAWILRRSCEPYELQEHLSNLSNPLQRSIAMKIESIVNCQPLTRDAIVGIFRNLKTRKAPGEYGNPGVILQHICAELQTEIHELFKNIWRIERWR